MEHYEESLPKYKQSKIELWKYLSPNDIEQLLKSFKNTEEVIKNRDYEHCKILFQSKFKLGWTRQDFILIDKYYFLIKFCAQNDFNKEQISALIFTLTKLHELMKSTAYGNLEQCYQYVKQMIILYSVHHPPFSLKLFSPEEAKLVLDYFVNTYLKHFKLYKLVYTPAIKLDLKFKYSNLIEEEKQSEIDRHSQISRNQQNEENIEEMKEEEGEEKSHKIVDLKEFVKHYLTQKVDKVKENITNEMKEQDSELNKKLILTNQSTPTTPKKGAKKTK
jgi:hypothetical protein